MFPRQLLEKAQAPPGPHYVRFENGATIAYIAGPDEADVVRGAGGTDPHRGTIFAAGFPLMAVPSDDEAPIVRPDPVETEVQRTVCRAYDSSPRHCFAPWERREMNQLLRRYKKAMALYMASGGTTNIEPAFSLYNRICEIIEGVALAPRVERLIDKRAQLHAAERRLRHGRHSSWRRVEKLRSYTAHAAELTTRIEGEENR